MFGYLSVFGDVTYPASRGGAVPARYERRSARWPRVRHVRWRRVRSSPEPGRPLGGRLGGYYSFPLFPNYHLGNEEKKTRRNRRERERREREREEKREKREREERARAKRERKIAKKNSVFSRFSETAKQSRGPPSQGGLGPSGGSVKGSARVFSARVEAVLAWRVPGLFGSFHRSNPKSPIF